VGSGVLCLTCVEYHASGITPRIKVPGIWASRAGSITGHCMEDSCVNQAVSYTFLAGLRFQADHCVGDVPAGSNNAGFRDWVVCRTGTCYLSTPAVLS
jgi:hypothetical protein